MYVCPFRFFRIGLLRIFPVPFGSLACDLRYLHKSQPSARKRGISGKCIKCIVGSSARSWLLSGVRRYPPQRFFLRASTRILDIFRRVKSIQAIEPRDWTISAKLAGKQLFSTRGRQPTQLRQRRGGHGRHHISRLEEELLRHGFVAFVAWRVGVYNSFLKLVWLWGPTNQNIMFSPEKSI